MIEWSDVDIAVRDAVREFVDKEIRPHVDELESGGATTVGAAAGAAGSSSKTSSSAGVPDSASGAVAPNMRSANVRTRPAA